MERILAHYAPNMSFDILSLRKVAEGLQRDHREQSISEGPTTQAEADDLDDLAIDEESFSIRAFPDNTTRECLDPVFDYSEEQAITWTNCHLY
jgi:hypothetical protein